MKLLQYILYKNYKIFILCIINNLIIIFVLKI